MNASHTERPPNAERRPARPPLNNAKTWINWFRRIVARLGAAWNKEGGLYV
jgi:hypothetical protein